MGRLWDGLLPRDFPAGYRPNASPGGAPPDICAAVVALLRVGLLVIDGIPIDAVTRSGLRPSPRGYQFIRNEEGLAPQIYWPGNDNSGVTVGPGYDMGSRDGTIILNDLARIGVPFAAATAASDAANLRGNRAGKFVRDHKRVLDLTVLQQQSLFDIVVPTYTELVRTKTPRPLATRLFQHEFDAMLSLAWNLRKYGTYAFNRDIASLDMVKADPSIRTLVRGGRGILPRRIRETLLFSDSVYQYKTMALRNTDMDFYDDLPVGTTDNG